MNFQNILPWITGPAGALVVFAFYQWLILVRGSLHTDGEMKAKDFVIENQNKEISEWRTAWQLERQRGDAAVLAAQTAQQVVGAFRREVGGGGQ